MGLSFSIEFPDLSSDKQEDMIESVRAYLLERWQEEAEEAMKDLRLNRWHVAPKTWQEWYCRTYDIDWEGWNSLDENEKEFQEYDWKYTLEEYAEDQAKNKCFDSMHHMEAEVEI